MSAAFSANIITEAFILPLIISGKDEASTTLTLSNPLTHNFSSSTANLLFSEPIEHVEEGWWPV